MKSNRLLGSTIASLLVFLLLSPVVLYSAEPKTVDQMVKERQAELASMAGLQKKFAENQATFAKLPAVVEYNRKQKELNDQAEKISATVQALERAIADAVAKGEATKK